MDMFSLTRDDYVRSPFLTGLKSILWIERFNRPGEFRITGNLAVIKEALPIGSFISNTKTNQVMEVEAYQIDEDAEDPSDIVAVGRTIDAIIMENRVVTLIDDATAWTTVATSAPDPLVSYATDQLEFILPAGYSWDHVEALLDHYLVNSPFGSIENLPNFALIQGITGATEPNNEPRIIPKLSLLSKAVYDILQAADIGLKIEHPTPDHLTDLHFIIHAGNDLSDTVRFGWNTSELRKGRYLWSNRDFRNGFYANIDDYTISNHARDTTGWDTRIVPVRVEDWVPDPVDYPTIQDTYEVISYRGRDVLYNHKYVQMIESISAKASNFIYGIDYTLGDIVHVDGHYEVGMPMRVVEHAMVYDRNGEDSMQSLAPVTSNITYTP